MMTYEEWKQVNKRNYTQDIVEIVNFGTKYPATAKQYQERKQREDAKRAEILAMKDRQARYKAISENMELFGL